MEIDFDNLDSSKEIKRNNNHCDDNGSGNGTKSGFVAIVGRPNVGKSTLLNKFIGTKVSITANKPQTTRHKILGVKTVGNDQIVFIDTPGIHKKSLKEINKIMNKSALSALYDVEVVLFVIEALKWTEQDELVINKITDAKLDSPVFLIVNKIDKVTDKNSLLPFMQEIGTKYNFKEIIPVSALKDDLTQLANFEKAIFKHIPDSPHFFDSHQVTDKDLKFRLAEIVREKLTRLLGQELPFALTVQIEAMEKEEKRYLIHSIIWVEKDSQKHIVIGKKGSKLKEVGIQARRDMEFVLDLAVHLKLWVKVKSGWSDSHKALQDLGFLDID